MIGGVDGPLSIDWDVVVGELEETERLEGDVKAVKDQGKCRREEKVLESRHDGLGWGCICVYMDLYI